jgi:hypothetical protein
MSDDNARERAIERARKLLAQAEHPNTSVEERQTFAAKAAEIMLRHDLAEAVVRASAANPTTETIDLWRFTLTGSGGHGRHRAWGLGDVAEAYGCAVCFTGNDAGNAPRTVNIVGTLSDLDTLRLLLPTVAALAETAAAQATQQHRQRLRDNGWYTDTELNRQATLYRRSFLRGFGSGVAAQIRDRREAVVAELSTPGTGGELVLVDRAARVVAEFGHRYPKVRKASRVRARSESGARDGFQAGQAANLGGNALDGDTRRHLPEA